MRNTEKPVTVRVVRRFDASPERVFDAWLDPATVGKWLFATPTGQMVRVEIDARVGGSFTIVERRDGVDASHFGEYLEIDRPHRLVFTFYVEKDAQNSSRVSIDVVPVDGGCELTLTHEMSPDALEYKARTEAGWGRVLDGLATVI